MSELTRRQWLALSTGALAASAGAAAAEAPGREDAVPTDFARSLRYCLNTATIREPQQPITERIDLVAAAGYDGIEPWIDELDRHKSSGGSLADLRKRLSDRGLTVESAIGFAEWIVDDPEQRRRGLDEARRTMEMVAELGGKRIAAPPAGAKQTVIDPRVVAERYRAMLEIGEQVGVTPQLEIWAHSQTLQQLPEAAYALLLADHPRGRLLTDVYHLYRGGSSFHQLSYLSGQALEVVHLNDYPGTPSREQLTDADRVYPGDGVAPLGEIMRNLAAGGFRGTLSLELFNRDYWRQDPAVVLRTGLEKMKAAVAAATAK